MADSNHEHDQQQPGRRLPPGQRRVAGLRRFGTHLHEPPPDVPKSPTLVVAGALTSEFAVPVSAFASFPRTQITADFHCVAGWSVTDLQWSGVAFSTFYENVVTPALSPGAPVTHIVTEGLDGYRCVVLLEDALAPDVLIADTLDGQPLTGDNGAPLRFVSPRQYGFVSNKHLSRIELHTKNPGFNFGSGSIYGRAMVRPLFARHPRSRVWAEERNSQLPNWLVRPIYRAITPPIAWLSKRGGQTSRT